MRKTTLISIYMFMVIMKAGNTMEQLRNDGVCYFDGLPQMERIEFDLILLPDEETSRQILNISSQILEAVKPLETIPLKPYWDGYANKAVTLPHISMGQYGLLKWEFDKLRTIVTQGAESFTPLEEPLAETIKINENNIFLNFQNIAEYTSPQVRNIYKFLRCRYMEKITTRFMTKQSLLKVSSNQDNPLELKLLKEYYQNTNIPEFDRIEPHFTLLYNYASSGEEVKKAIAGIKIPDSLNCVKIEKIGIVEIDTWGNPSHLLYIKDLTKAKTSS